MTISRLTQLIARHTGLISLLWLLSPWSTANHQVIDSLQWQLQKESPDVKVFSASVPNSKHRAVLSITTIDKDPHTIAKLIQDTSTCQQWVYRCQHSKIYQQLSDNEAYIYTASNMPFPAKDRDILAHIKWEEDPDTNIITVTGMATSGILEKNRQQIRIENAKMIWELTPLKNGHTQVRNFAHIDPAGGIPSWLSNALSVEAPLATMIGLRNIFGQTTRLLSEEQDISEG